MKQKFHWLYPLAESDVQALWEQATFVLDTNIVLSLYRVTKATSDDLFKVLEGIRTRVWIPHQVGLEFSRNRSKKIIEYRKIHEDERGRLESFRKTAEEYGIPVNLDEKLETEAKAIARYDELLKHDTVLERVETLIGDALIGDGYGDERLDELFKEADRRFQERVPPGFGDEGKKEKPACYGDYVLWRQILDFAKQHTKPIVFVTDDRKKNDWYETSPEGHTVGPLALLRQEFSGETGVRLFWMYPLRYFLEGAQTRLRITVAVSTVTEVASSQDAKMSAGLDECVSSETEPLAGVFRQSPTMPASAYLNALSGGTDWATTLDPLKQLREQMDARRKLISQLAMPSDTMKVFLEQESAQREALRNLASRMIMPDHLKQMADMRDQIRKMVELGNFSDTLAAGALLAASRARARTAAPPSHEEPGKEGTDHKPDAPGNPTDGDPGKNGAGQPGDTAKP
jgi:hypothetical protein